MQVSNNFLFQHQLLLSIVCFEVHHRPEKQTDIIWAWHEFNLEKKSQKMKGHELPNLVKPSLHDGGNIEANQEGDDSVSDHHVGIELQEDSLGPQLADIDVESLSIRRIDIWL